jgi:hypothetical protein
MPLLAEKKDVPGRASTLRDLPTVTYATDGCVMSYWRNIIINAWGVPASTILAGELRKIMAHVSAEYTRWSTVHVVIGASSLPAKDVRAEFAKISKDFQHEMEYSAILIWDDGFWASAVRSLITGMAAFTNRPAQIKLCGSADELARWMAQGHSTKTGELVEVAELTQAVEWLVDRPQVRAMRTK